MRRAAQASLICINQPLKLIPDLNWRVQDLRGGQIEAAAINRAISMEHVGNPTLKAIAEAVTSSLGASSPQS